MSAAGEEAREKLVRRRPEVLDLAHAFAILQFRARKLNMVTAPIGTGGLTRRYAVPIQQRGLTVGRGRLMRRVAVFAASRGLQ